MLATHMIGIDPHFAYTMIDLNEIFRDEIEPHFSKDRIRNIAVESGVPVITTYLLTKFGDQTTARIAFVIASLTTVNLSDPLIIAAKRGDDKELYHCVEAVLGTAHQLMHDYVEGKDEAVKLVNDKMQDELPEMIAEFLEQIGEHVQHVNEAVEELTSHNQSSYTV